MADKPQPQYSKTEAEKAAKEAVATADKVIAALQGAQMYDDADSVGLTARLDREEREQPTITPQDRKQGAAVLAAAYPAKATPKAQPAVQQARPVQASTRSAPAFDDPAGEIISGISAVTYAIPGQVFGEVPQFRQNVKDGILTREQHAAFYKGGNALIGQLPEETSGQFSDYLSDLVIKVGQAAYPGQDYKGKAIYAGIAGQMDMWRTSGMSPEQVAAKMQEPGSIRDTVALIRLLEKPASSFPETAKPSPEFLASMERTLGGDDKPESLIPEGFYKKPATATPAPQPVKAAAVTRPAGATDSVTRSLEAVFAADSRMAEFQKQFQLNGQLSAKFGVDQGGYGRADIDGNGRLDKKDFYAMLAPAVEMLKQGYSVADIAKQIGSPDYMDKATEELSRTTGTRIATVGPDGYNHGGKTGGPGR